MFGETNRYTNGPIRQTKGEHVERGKDQYLIGAVIGGPRETVKYFPRFKGTLGSS